MRTYENAVFAALVAWTLVATMLIFTLGPLSFVQGDEVQPLLLCLALIGAALVYERRGIPNFALCLTALTVLVAFSTVFSVLVYGLAATPRPLADDFLAASDAALGISAGSILHWVNARPWLALIMRVAYFSAIPQTIVAIVVLGFKNEKAALHKFLLRFMLCGLITAGAFCFLPALGTCASFAVPVPSYYAPVLRDLQDLRCGSLEFVTWRSAEGLITFPSFHAIWAVLLALAFCGQKYLFGPLAVLNVVMILSTVTTGMHYATDVIGGLLICAFVVPLSNWIFKEQQASASAPQLIGN